MTMSLKEIKERLSEVQTSRRFTSKFRVHKLKNDEKFSVFQINEEFSPSEDIFVFFGNFEDTANFINRRV